MNSESISRAQLLLQYYAALDELAQDARKAETRAAVPCVPEVLGRERALAQSAAM